MPLKMRSNPSSRFPLFKLKTLSAAVISAVVLSNTYAAGLGKLTVMSSLGQPLRAEIELTSVSPDELASLAPKLASADAFRQANIEFNPSLFSLRFAVEQRGGQPVVRVTSTQPINEPFVDMLLELGGNNGRLVREYTFLLDPPEMRSAQPAQVAPIVIAQPLPPVARQQPESKPEPVAAPIRENPAPRAAAKPQRAVAAPKPEVAPTDEYVVKKGDTLAKIASQYRPSGVSLDQMLVALYRANPEAFIDKNMNRLRAGHILSVPEADTAQGVKQSEAKGVVIAQAADFNAYRNKLAGQVATAAAKKSDDVKQTAGGKISTRIQEDSAAAAESKDKLKLSKSGAASTAASGKLVNQAGAEELIAKDKAIADANARVKELEKNVNELQQILEIKNKDLAAQQKQAEAATKVAPVVTPPAPAAVTPAEPVAATPDTAAVTPPAVEVKPDAPAAVEPAVVPPVAAVKPKLVVVPPPPPQPSFFEDLTNNAMFLPGAAALLALLAGLGIYSSRRRKQAPKSFEDSITDSSLKTNSLFGSTGGQSVDTNNSVFNSNFVPSASQLDTNEVDPIAEADVYIAYGRDAQAEEILKEALRNQPDRHAVRVKLLEIYSSRNDVRSFEILASELYSMTKGEGDEWAQAATLGLILDPSNPLYANGALPEEVAAKASALTAPTERLNEHDGLNAIAPVAAAAAALGTAAYFDSSNSSAEETSQQETSVPEVESKATVEDLDFDLEGLDIESPIKKLGADVSAQTDLPEDVAAIDFDFLGDQSVTPTAKEDTGLSFFEEEKESNTLAFTPAPEILLPEDIDLDFPEQDAAHLHSATTPTALPEFDLSDIALELDPQETLSVHEVEALPALDSLGDEESYTSNAEMATKLDLAIAYQEIGDKEGARELLEEVVKGGNGEQSEKAKHLLSKLS